MKNNIDIIDELSEKYIVMFASNDYADFIPSRRYFNSKDLEMGSLKLDEERLPLFCIYGYNVNRIITCYAKHTTCTLIHHEGIK
jgi:hypothetical protein